MKNILSSSIHKPSNRVKVSIYFKDFASGRRNLFRAYSAYPTNLTTVLNQFFCESLICAGVIGIYVLAFTVIKNQY